MLNILVFLMFLSILLVDSAYAYIDFGTGSYVLQILAASAIGAIFFIKRYLNTIKRFFTRKSHSEADMAETTKEDEQ